MTVDILGRGWAFPISARLGGDVALVEGADDVRQAVRLILETEPGERVMRPDFGCGLRGLVFAPINVGTLALVRHRIEEGLTRWEPRIDVEDIRIDSSEAPSGKLTVEVVYRIRATNTFDNLVYPLYLREAPR